MGVAPVTSGWTRRHSAVALAMGAACSGVLVGLVEPSPYGWVVAGVVALVAVSALATDALTGIVVGLVGAAALIGAKQIGGVWRAEWFWPSLMESLILLVVGMASGRAGQQLHDSRRKSRRPDGPTADPSGDAGTSAAFGSLGLLPADLALVRLEDEVERAKDHERPLSVVLFGVEVTEGALSQEARRAALRAVVRAVDSRLRDTDVPFALTESELGAVLPEADTGGAWDRVGPIMDACQVMSFRDRSVPAPRALADTVELRVGIAVLGIHGESAEGLLDAAIGNVRTVQVSQS